MGSKHTLTHIFSGGQDPSNPGSTPLLAGRDIYAGAVVINEVKRQLPVPRGALAHYRCSVDSCKT